MSPNPEAPKSSVADAVDWSKDQLGRLKESTIESSNKILDWFKDLFTKIKEKGLKESFFGPLLGFLSALGNIKEPESNKPAETSPVAEAHAQLDQLSQGIKPSAFDPSAIRSFGCEIKDGMTYCSLTARLNIDKLAPGKKFMPIQHATVKQDIQKIRDDASRGIYSLKDVIPTGDARDIEMFYIIARKEDTLSGNTDEKINGLNQSGKTVCDIVTAADSMFGHRAVGFKGTDGNWYVLDPYRYPNRVEPIPLKEYADNPNITIKFVVPIDTSRPLPKPDGAIA